MVKMQKLPAVPTIFTLFAVILLSSLGIWQAKRLVWKNELLNSIQQADARPMHDYSLNNQDNNLGDYLYQNISVTGKFIYDKELLVGPRHLPNSKDIGFFSVIPLLTDNNKYIMINRGMIHDSYKDQQSRASSLPQEEITIIGRVMPMPKKTILAPSNYPIKGVWTWLDHDLIASHYNINIDPYVVIAANTGLENNINNQDIHKIPGSPILIKTSNIRNDHLEYMITWFAFAITAFVIYCLYLRSYWNKNKL